MLIKTASPLRRRERRVACELSLRFFRVFLLTGLPSLHTAQSDPLPATLPVAWSKQRVE